MSVNLIYFSAPWYRVCEPVGAIVDELLREGVRVKKCNVDADAGVAAKYGVRSLPTIVIERDGAVVDTLVGTKSKSDIQQALNRACC